MRAAGAQEHEHHRASRRQIALHHPDGHERSRADAAQQQPGAPPHQKIGQGAPQEIDHRRQRQQRNQLRRAQSGDALLPHDVGQHTTLDNAVAGDRGWGDEQTEDPWPLGSYGLCL